MTAADYIGILEESAVSAVASFGKQFMDDNAPIHRSSSVKQWMHDNGVPSINWPPYSPDLNPIENIWGILKRRLRRSTPAPTTVEEVAHKFEQTWNGLSVCTLHKLYDGMPARVHSCILKKRFPIRY